MLFDIVLRYRMYPVALVGDVQKAFHQIEVAVEDKDCLRFLWVEDPKNVISELSELRFTWVIFGAGPSPFLLNATMQRHIGGYEETDPGFVRLVVKSLFVDDFVGGGRNSTEVITLKKKRTDVMQEGGFTLHKWKSNIEEVCSSPSVDSEGDEDETFAKQQLNLDESQSKVLGIKWNPRSDIMAVELSQVAEEAERDLRMTKRELLSRLSRIYDPLGVAGPITIVGRKIFQDACKEGITWDSLEYLHGRWKTFERNLKQRSKIEFPRCVALSEKPKEMSLHTFADASQTAYCAAVYLVVRLLQGKFSNLLTAKTRLPPLKKEMTIPRLELTTARIVSRLAATVKQALVGFELKRVCMWSDSCTVLHWLQRRGQFRQFVEHRVKEIEHLSNGPIHLKGNEKAYIALFTCAVTRAVHLELTKDMTATEFRVVLQRFVSRRGAPSTVISDNAKTFKSTGKQLKKISDNENWQGYLTTKRIDWIFNVSKAPWQGGFFDRLVGISKSALYKVLGRSKLSFREVETMLIQVEGLMNNRRLTYQTDELESEPLTPNHMIFGYALPNIANDANDANEEMSDDEESSARVNKRLKYVSTIKAHLWKRWTREYLQGLKVYQRQADRKSRVPEIGEIMLIIDSTIQRRHWRMAK